MISLMVRDMFIALAIIGGIVFSPEGFALGAEPRLVSKVVWPEESPRPGQPIVVEVVLHVDEPVYIADRTPKIALVQPGQGPADALGVRPFREGGGPYSSRRRSSGLPRKPLVKKGRTWRLLIWTRWGDDRKLVAAMDKPGMWGVRASLRMSPDHVDASELCETNVMRGRDPWRGAAERGIALNESVSRVAEFGVDGADRKWDALVDMMRASGEWLVPSNERQRTFLQEQMAAGEKSYRVVCGWLLLRSYASDEEWHDRVNVGEIKTKNAKDLARVARYVIKSGPERCMISWDAALIRASILIAEEGITGGRVRRAKRLISRVPEGYSRLSSLLRSTANRPAAEVVQEVRRFRQSRKEEKAQGSLEQALEKITIGVSAYSLDHNGKLPGRLAELTSEYVTDEALKILETQGGVLHFAGDKYDKMAEAGPDEPMLVVRSVREPRFYVVEISGKMRTVGREQLAKTAEEFDIDLDGAE